MALTTTQQLLDEVVAARTGVAAFNVITLESAEGIVMGAERAHQPVILQVSENATLFHRADPRPVAAALAALGSAAGVPVALHLDHVENLDLLHAAATAGFSSVMVDAGRLPYAENVATTRRAARWAHDHGLAVEAELGYVGGKASQEGSAPAAYAQSAHDAGVRTDPEQAAEFVRATGVDALAVAVGSSHAMTSRTASLDLDLIERLAAAVPAPLVLHGSSGVPDENLAAAIRAGMRKINIGTALSVAYTDGVRAILGANPELTDPRTYLTTARANVAEQVETLLGVIAAAQPDPEPATGI